MIMFKLTHIQVSIFLGTAGICAVFAYVYMKNRDLTIKRKKRRAEKKEVTINLPVPLELVPAIIGSGAGRIKAMQKISKASINLQKEGTLEGTKMCTIKGTLDSCKLAESMILEILAEHQWCENEVITIEKAACGPIIGRGGSVIKSLCSSSRAKIRVSSQRNVKDSGPVSIYISGTRQQIALAKELIYQILFRFRSRDVTRIRMFNNRISSKLTKSDVLEVEEDVWGDTVTEFPNEIEGLGCISAFSDTDHVYIQKVGAVRLRTELENKMTRHYSSIGNYQTLRLKDIRIGNEVAAQYGESNIWSRGRVAEIRNNDIHPERSSLIVIFIDCGESGLKNFLDVRYLDKEFCKMPPLAVECILDCPSGKEWPPVSLEAFDKLVPVAKGYEVTVECVGKKTNIFGHTVPVVRIIDHQSPNKTNIGEELDRLVHN